MSSNSNKKKKGLTDTEKTVDHKTFASKFSELSKSKTFMRIITIVVAVILISVILGVSGVVNLNPYGGSNGSGNSSGLPSFIKAGEFANISSSNIGTKNQINIYFMSWRGCPIGAAESWILYQYINQTYHSRNYIISYHYSDPSENIHNIPGLLFTNFSFNNGKVQINFHVDYVYPEQFPQTPTPSQALVNEGITTLKSTSGFPPAAINDFVDYETMVPTQPNPSSTTTEPLANYAGHLTTCIIISGNNGTFFLEGALYSPVTIQGQTYSYMLNNSAQFTGITNGENYISQIVNDAQ